MSWDEHIMLIAHTGTCVCVCVARRKVVQGVWDWGLCQQTTNCGTQSASAHPHAHPPTHPLIIYSSLPASCFALQ